MEIARLLIHYIPILGGCQPIPPPEFYIISRGMLEVYVGSLGGLSLGEIWCCETAQ